MRYLIPLLLLTTFACCGCAKAKQSLVIRTTYHPVIGPEVTSEYQSNW